MRIRRGWGRRGGGAASREAQTSFICRTIAGAYFLSGSASAARKASPVTLSPAASCVRSGQSCLDGARIDKLNT